VDPSGILERLEGMGVKVTVVGDKLRLNPGEAVPAVLLEEVKQHKPELITIIRLRDYRLRYSEVEVTEKELAEIVARVYHEGYVLLWSSVLHDLIAFCRSEEDKNKVPPGFVPYSLMELKELFSLGSKFPENELRLIHEVKRRGGRVTDRS